MAPNASSSSPVGTSSSAAGSLPHLQIVDKLTELPLVHSALDYANTRYAALKSSSALVGNTLDRAEKSFQLALNTGLPVVAPVLNKLEQPIHLADNIAVQGLGLAVAKIDAIQKSSGELKDSTRKVVDQTKERLSAARATAVQTVHSKVQSVMTLPSNVVPLLDQILSAGENVLDYLLPEADKDGAAKSQNGSANGPLKPEDGSDAKAVIRLVIYRMRLFTDKVQKRVVDYSREKWIPAVFASVVVIQKNVLGLVANGVASKLIAANGHANSAPASASASPALVANSADESNKSSTPKKQQPVVANSNSSPKNATNSSPAAPSSTASNGDVKAQQQQQQDESHQDLDQDDSLSS